MLRREGKVKSPAENVTTPLVHEINLASRLICLIAGLLAHCFRGHCHASRISATLFVRLHIYMLKVASVAQFAASCHGFINVSNSIAKLIGRETRHWARTQAFPAGGFNQCGCLALRFTLHERRITKIALCKHNQERPTELMQYLAFYFYEKRFVGLRLCFETFGGGRF
jgi:hypothetical protein